MEKIILQNDKQFFNYNKNISIIKAQENYLNYVFTYNVYETYTCYKHHLSVIVEYLISMYDIQFDTDIKLDYLMSFINFQKTREIANSTINKRINVFKRMLIHNNSTTDLSFFRTLKEKYTTFNYLNDVDLRKLVDYVKTSKMSIQNKLMIFLFLESGIRRKELKHIEIKNIDLENSIILLTTTKTNKNRFVCYSDLSKMYIYDHLKIRLNEKYLFNITYDSITDCFTRIKKQLNFNYFSCHVLRHTYSTIIVNNDGNIEMLRQTLGHERLTTTQRYIHYNTSFIKNSYDKFFVINKG